MWGAIYIIQMLLEVLFGNSLREEVYLKSEDEKIEAKN